MPNENTGMVCSDSAPPLPAIAPPADGVAPPTAKLSQEQTNALEAIMEGKSTAAILEAAGVNRTTLWRWRTFDANFVAALNQWRHDVQIRVRDRVVNVIEDAADVVHITVRERNGRLALSVLDKSGNLKPQPIGPLDPYSIFGAGIDDENGRHTAYEGFVAARGTLNAEQQGRIVQIFALGIVADNDRMGYPSSPAIRQIAKHQERPRVQAAQELAGSLTTQTGRGLSDDGSTGERALPDPDPEPAPPSPPRQHPRGKSVTIVTARAVGYRGNIGTFYRK